MFDVDITPLSSQVVWTPVLIFCLRVTDVSMGTIRTLMITRGIRSWATLIGFVEVTIWIVAVSQVITNLDNVWNILGYSGGFAAGTLLGMWLESKMALGHVETHVISTTKGAEVAKKLRAAGYGATELQARGQSGFVCQVDVVTTRKQLAEVIRIVNEVDPTSFVTIDDARQVVRGYRRLGK
jgi:uncharacterized protein YebE (UPF0316 family)